MFRHKYLFSGCNIRVFRSLGCYLGLVAVILWCFFGVTMVSAAPPDVPVLKTPQKVLGFKPGTDRTIADWAQITNYFQQLDQASASVQLQNIGRTTLGRPMFAAFISAPDNIRDLARYQEIQRQLADPRTVPDNATRARLLRDGKNVDNFVTEVPPDNGTLLVFKRSDTSWHGHHPFEGPRRSLQMNWMTSEGSRGWHKVRHKLSATLKKITAAE